MPKTKKPNFTKASLGKPAKSSRKKPLKRGTLPSSKSKVKKTSPRHSGKPSNARRTRNPGSGIVASLLSSATGTFGMTKAISQMTLKTKVLLVLGILLFGISFMWHANQTIQLAFFTPKVSVMTSTQAAPVSIEIPRVKMNLPVEQTAITGGVWGVSQKGASYLGTSARPGEAGPIILYSHNTDDRFGPIRWLMPEDEIVITTIDNKSHNYTVKKLMTVSPNQIEAVSNYSEETLILYTCDGFADLQRFVVIAVPQ